MGGWQVLKQQKPKVRENICADSAKRVEKERRKNSSPSMGSKFGEVSESVSALYRPLSMCLCACVCVRVLNTFNILWCRLQASMGQTDTKELAETRASQ